MHADSREIISTDKKFILSVVNKATVYHGKKLLRNEIEGIVSYIREIDLKSMAHEKHDVVIDKIAKNFVVQLNSRIGSSIDMQEVMKRHIGTIRNTDPQSLYSDITCPLFSETGSIRDDKVLKSIDNFTQMGSFGSKARNTDETNKIYMQDGKMTRHDTTGIAHQLENSALPFSSDRDKYPRIAKQKVQNIYLLLDSKYRNLSTDDSVFKWTVLHSQNTQQGTVNTLSDQIHNIINIQFDRIRIPYVESADNLYKKIALSIDEFSSMSVLTNSGNRYHMLFDSVISGNQLELTPQINDEGRFRFHTPINILDTITIKFQSPFSPVEFNKDRYGVSLTSINPTQSILTFSEPHKVSDGELVHLEEYTTLDAIADVRAVETVNREVGHIVTFINNTVLRINVDTSTTTHDASNIVKCFIASRRIIIPVRLEYMM